MKKEDPVVVGKFWGIVQDYFNQLGKLNLLLEKASAEDRPRIQRTVSEHENSRLALATQIAESSLSASAQLRLTNALYMLKLPEEIPEMPRSAPQNSGLMPCEA